MQMLNVSIIECLFNPGTIGRLSFEDEKRGRLMDLAEGTTSLECCHVICGPRK